MSIDHLDVLQRLAAVISARFEDARGQVTRETTADDVRGWDSLSHAFLLLDVEQDFGLEIPPAAGVEVANVGELADLICEIRREREGAEAR